MPLPKENWSPCCTSNLLLSHTTENSSASQAESQSACPAISQLYVGTNPCSAPCYLPFPCSLSDLVSTHGLTGQGWRVTMARCREQSGHNLGRSGLFIVIIMFTTLEFVFIILAQSRVHQTINNGYHTELTCYCDADKTTTENSNLSQAISSMVPRGFCRN